MNRRALVACEESQVICIELRRLGWEAYSCDIQECSGGHPEWHIMQDVIPLINGFCTFRTMDGTEHVIDSRWDLLIAHPPCTFLSNAGACRLYPRKGELNQERYQKGLEAKAFFMCFLNASCRHIVVENPLPSKIFQMPPCSQSTQPYFHGDPYTKKTLLWLVNLPLLEPTNIVEPIGPYVPSGTGRKDKTTYGHAKRGDDARNRSKTFPGIGKAIAEQFTAYIEKEALHEIPV